jgi:hypothetical protein
MSRSQFEIVCQLTSIRRQSTSGEIYEQTVMNFKNTAHGFCAEGSHLADSRAVFKNFAWFESSFCFSEHERAIFRDGRFSNVADTQSNSCSGPNYGVGCQLSPCWLPHQYHFLKYKIANGHFKNIPENNNKYMFLCLTFICFS